MKNIMLTNMNKSHYIMEMRALVTKEFKFTYTKIFIV